MRKAQGESSQNNDAERKFFTTAYVKDEEGEVDAVLPDRCANGGDGAKCKICRHDSRERKQGPDHPLVVVRCREHGVYFTLYPPGWTPWSRRPIMDESSDDPPFEAAREAAQQAASGTLWPRHDSRGQSADNRVARSQSRRIERAACWLGLVDGSNPREAIFEALRLPSLTQYRQAYQRWEEGAGRCGCARIVLDVLDTIPIDDTLLERLLRAGTATQVFDVVYMVDHTGVIRRLPPLGSG